MADVEARLQALESELQRVKDHLAIYQIVSRYGPSVDCTEDEAQRYKAANLWAEDGLYDVRPDRKYPGPDKIVEMLNSELHCQLVAGGSAHVSAMPYVRVEGDKAMALGYAQLMRHQDGAFVLFRSSIALWEFERRAGEWKVMRRTIRLLDGSQDSKSLLRRLDAPLTTAA